jgi:glycosyltransferase involved in cell wall biosynthesis
MPLESNNRRIAIFLPGLYEGGAERVMLNLASGFLSKGYDIDLVLSQAEGPYMADIPEGVRLIELNKKHFSAQRTINSLPALIRYIRGERPVGMISSLNFANVVALLAKQFSGVPFRLAISEHNTFSVERVQFSQPFRWLLQNFMKYLYPTADGIVAVSEGVADDLAKVLRLPRHKILVIHNPVISPDISYKKEADLDDPWFEENQPPVILAIGRLTKQKAFDVLLRAFAIVRKQRNARLIILGEGEDRPELFSLQRELGLEDCVRLPGFVPNPYQYLKHSGMFVLSSRWEGLPTVLIEALYCGLPLIATDCPSGPREILHDGLYGRLIPVDDISGLAKAILSVLDGEKPEIPPSSWEAYELMTIVREYEDVLMGNGLA